MKRVLALATALAAATLLAACTSSEPFDIEPPPGHEGGPDAAPVTVSPELERALREMDCANVTLTAVPDVTDTDVPDENDGSMEQAGIEIREAGRCVPFAGVEQVEFYEFASADDARTWLASDATTLSGVDNAYITGAVIIIDRNNDYLMQLTMQFDTAS